MHADVIICDIEPSIFFEQIYGNIVEPIICDQIVLEVNISNVVCIKL